MTETRLALHRIRSSCNHDDFRRALRHVASTVHVVATRSEGQFFATTATAVISVCLDPPTLAVCLNRSNAMAKHVRYGSAITISALARHQSNVAQACAGGVPHEERVRFFGEGDLGGQGGVAGAEACFAGTCVDVVDIGTHALLVVNIESVVSDGDVSPLIYLDAKYGGFEGRA